MNTRVRSELIRMLEGLSRTIPAPGYRFGQMIANLAFHARGEDPSGVWNVEDEELLAAARDDLEVWRRGEQEGPASEAERSAPDDPPSGRTS